MQADTPPGKVIGDRVRMLREARQLEPGQMAAFAKVSPSWVSRLEAGEVPRPSGVMLAKIARVLRVSVDNILRGEEPMRPRTPQEILRELEAVTPIMVPETTQPASAGPGTFADAEHWPFQPGPTERSHRFIAVPVAGDCMEPRLHEGERVVVDLDASPMPGSIVVAVHDDETLIKMLEKRDGDLYLVAMQHRPPLKVGERTRILGVVKMAMHRP